MGESLGEVVGADWVNDVRQLDLNDRPALGPRRLGKQESRNEPRKQKTYRK